MGNVCCSGKGNGMGPINKFCKCGGPRPKSGHSRKGSGHSRKGSGKGRRSPKGSPKGRRRKGSHSS